MRRQPIIPNFIQEVGLPIVIEEDRRVETRTVDVNGFAPRAMDVIGRDNVVVSVFVWHLSGVNVGINNVVFAVMVTGERPPDGATGRVPCRLMLLSGWSTDVS